MKHKLILPLAKLLLAAAALTLAACSGAGNNYSSARVVDPFPNHIFHNHCQHSNHCPH